MLVRTLFLLVLGLGALVDAGAADVPDAAPVAAPAVAPIEIVVDQGYHPERIVVKAGQPVRLKFVRTEYSACSREVVFPTLGIRRTLPTNEPVEIDLGTPAAGEIPFHCWMHMLHGVIVVEP